MDRALLQVAGDLGGRQVEHLDVVEADDDRTEGDDQCPDPSAGCSR